MRVLVIGAGGLLGHALARLWGGRPGWEVAAADLRPPYPGCRALDILDAEAVRDALAETSPDVAVLTASDPHVDGCEAEPARTRRLNVEATLGTARLSRAAGARFVCFSSDYVFDGARGGYREADEPRPLCEYGRQKLAVEKELAGMGEGALSVRVAALFGWELQPKNYVLQVLSRLREGRPVQAAADQDYSATYVDSLAEALAAPLERKAWGLLHLAGAETLSRYELARAAARTFGLDESLVRPARAADFAGGGRAERPLHSALDSSTAERLFNARVCGAREGLARMRSSETAWREAVERLATGAKP